jgi:hypothetical protein
MEPEGSLPHSQAPANCPYPEPDQSSPCLPIPLLEDPINAYVFQVVSLPKVSPQNPCIHLSRLPYVPHAPSISFFFIWFTRITFGEAYRPQSSAGLERVLRYRRFCVFYRRHILTVMNRWNPRPSKVTLMRHSLPADTTNKELICYL